MFPFGGSNLETEDSPGKTAPEVVSLGGCALLEIQVASFGVSFILSNGLAQDHTARQYRSRFELR